MSRKKKHNKLIPYPDLEQIAGVRMPQIQNAVMLNSSRFNDYMAQLLNLAMSRFEWLNLPETVDERFLEFTLLNQGSIAFFNGADDKMNGFFATQWVSQKPLNVYLNPTKIRSIGSNGWNYEVGDNQFVIIWENNARTPTIKTLMNFAYKLTDIDRTLDVLRKHAKMPYFIVGNQAQEETMQNLWKQIDGNEPAVICYDDAFSNIQTDAIQTMNQSLPQTILALQQNKQDIMNECLEFLGISQNNPSKVQQMSIGESDRKEESVKFSLWSFMEPRRQAVAEINRKFHLDIQVVVAHDIVTDNFNMRADEMIATTVNKGADKGGVANKQDGGRDL